MRKYFLGFLFGFTVGATTSLYAAKIVGGNGWLIGWDITIDGDTVCSDPYIWVSIREIECD